MLNNHISFPPAAPFLLSLLFTLPGQAEITLVPRPVVTAFDLQNYGSDAHGHFRNAGIYQLHDERMNLLANGSSVTVAQIENRLPAHEEVIDGKTMIYHGTGGDPAPDLETGRYVHANLVASFLFSSVDLRAGSSKYTGGVAPGISTAHAFTVTAYRDEILNHPTATFADFGIQVANFSNTLGDVETNEGNRAHLRKHEKMLAEENILAFHVQPPPGGGIGSFSHTLWNGITVGSVPLFDADHGESNHGQETIYENLVVNETELKRQSPLIVSTDTQDGLLGFDACYSTPVVASGGALLLDYAHARRPEAANNLVIKSILLTGATKERPSDTSYNWSNHFRVFEGVKGITRPLDLQMGAGLYNINNSYRIIEQARCRVNAKGLPPYGWDHSVASSGRERSYEIEVPVDGTLISTLCWHREISEDLSSFEVPDLQLALDKWNATSASWERIVRSDSKAENFEHLFESLLAGRYRFAINNLTHSGTPYGISWRIDPAQRSTLILSEDTSADVDAPYLTTYEVTEPGNLSITVRGRLGDNSQPNRTVITVFRDLDGAWTPVAEDSSQYGNINQLVVPVTPGSYQIQVGIQQENQLIEFKITARLFPAPDVSNAQGSVLQAMIDFGNLGEPSIVKDGGLSIRMPLLPYLQDYQEAIILQHAPTMEAWSDDSAATRAPYAVEGTPEYGLQWSNPFGIELSKGFFRFNLGN